MDLQALRIEVAKGLGYKFHNLSDKDDHDFTNGYWQTPVGILLPADLPDWPCDPAATARDVLPEIVRRGWDYQVASRFYGEPDIEATEPTFALAVCRAYLAACKAAE